MLIRLYAKERKIIRKHVRKTVSAAEVVRRALDVFDRVNRLDDQNLWLS